RRSYNSVSSTIHPLHTTPSPYPSLFRTQRPPQRHPRPQTRTLTVTLAVSPPSLLSTVCNSHRSLIKSQVQVELLDLRIHRSLAKDRKSTRLNSSIQIISYYVFYFIHQMN